MITFGEFKSKYYQCPFCKGTDFKIWTHLIDGSALEYICDNCWIGNFGWQITFTTKDGKIDDNALSFIFRAWDGECEAWFYFGDSPYFSNFSKNKLNVLIVERGPISDNPVEGRLRNRLQIPNDEFELLFQGREQMLAWIKNNKSI